MKLFKDIPCAVCQTLALLSIFLIGALSVIGFQYVKKEKENETLTNSIALL